MLLTENVDVQITARNINHYKEKGYEIPMKYSDKSKKYILDSSKKITVKLEDLPDSSHTKITYKCDGCGEIFEAAYSDWKKRKHQELGDFCNKCAVKIKVPYIMQEKYGYSNAANVPFIIEKKKETNLKKYGTEWAISSEQVRKNIVETFENKYQVKNPMQNETIKQKAMDTNIARYGGKSSMCDKNVREKSIETCLKKYGVKNAFQSKEVQAKARKTLYKNNSTPSSKAEQNMCNILKDLFGEDNCIPCFPEGNLSLDCLVKIENEKIDVEYDGTYWHKDKGQIDAARNAVLMNLGYRILRIKGNNKDTMPTKEQIKDAIDYLVKDNHYLVFIDMNK